jgi:hypothetical protein
LTNCIQLQRSDLFLADRQEQVLSHSVVTCTNYGFNNFLYPNHGTGEVIPTGLFHYFAFRLRTDDPYGAKNFRKNLMLSLRGALSSEDEIGSSSDFSSPLDTWVSTQALFKFIYPLSKLNIEFLLYICF